MTTSLPKEDKRWWFCLFVCLFVLLFFLLFYHVGPLHSTSRTIGSQGGSVLLSFRNSSLSSSKKYHLHKNQMLVCRLIKGKSTALATKRTCCRLYIVLRVTCLNSIWRWPSVPLLQFCSTCKKHDLKFTRGMRISDPGSDEGGGGYVLQLLTIIE